MTWKMIECSQCDSYWPVSEMAKSYICPDCYIKLEMEKVN
jgi:predicted RNA-binding Zn-ribbon protein involved in translation (DUF1610 family)